MVLCNKKGLKMESEILELGHFDYREGGKIKLSINNNMRTNMGAFTEVHEINHMHLAYMTDLGFLLNALELERYLSSDENSEYSKFILKYIDVINNSMAYVQEVYANSIELLMAEKTVGFEFARKLYDSKTDQYRQYCDVLSDVLNKPNNTYMDKRLIVNCICYYAFHLDFESEEFLSALKSPMKLKQYLTGDNGPIKRMFKAIEILKNNQNIEIKSNGVCDIKSFIEKMSNMNLIKYSLNSLKESIDQFFIEVESDIKNDEKIIDQMMKDYELLMLKKTKAFDVSKFKVIRDDSKKTANQFLVIKNCLSLDNIKDNFYTIKKGIINNKFNYIGREISGDDLKDYIEESEFVMLISKEYDFTKNKPKYFEAQNKPLIVIFDDYFECSEWLNDPNTIKDIYVGNLYDKTVKNFFTVLFFKPRIMEKTIFIFPTLSWLGDKLLEESGLENEVIYSNNEAFLKLISCFGNEPSMLKCMQGIISFITESRGDFSDFEDSSTRLNYDTVRTLFSKVMEIKQQDYYEFHSSLPTKNTVAEPFYAIMTFKCNVNTGVMAGFDATNGILLFKSKLDAEEWRKARLSKDNMVVGIDRFYWDKLKKRLKTAKQRVSICFDLRHDKAASFDVDVVDSMIHQFSK